MRVTFEMIDGFPGEKVSFYTVRLGSSALTEFELFDAKDFSCHEKELELLYVAIEEMCYRGAQRRYFNNEGPAEYMPVVSAFVKDENKSDFGIRLYCIWISSSVVVLLNGGIKTKHKPEDCPNVAIHCSRALKISRLLYKKLAEQEIALDNPALQTLELDL